MLLARTHRVCARLQELRVHERAFAMAGPVERPRVSHARMLKQGCDRGLPALLVHPRRMRKQERVAGAIGFVFGMRASVVLHGKDQRRRARRNEELAFNQHLAWRGGAKVWAACSGNPPAFVQRRTMYVGYGRK
jgi:hypothetical protein